MGTAFQPESLVGPGGLGLHHIRLRAQAARKRSCHRGAGLRQSQPGDGGSRRQSEHRKEHKEADHIELVSMTIQPGQEIIVGQTLRAILSAAQKGKPSVSEERSLSEKNPREGSNAITIAWIVAIFGRQSASGSGTSRGSRDPLRRIASTRPAWIQATTFMFPDRDLVAQTAACLRLLKHRSGRLWTTSSQLSKPRV